MSRMDEEKLTKIKEGLVADYELSAREFLCIERAIRNACEAGLSPEDADKFARDIIDALE